MKNLLVDEGLVAPYHGSTTISNVHPQWSPSSTDDGRPLSAGGAVAARCSRTPHRAVRMRGEVVRRFRERFRRDDGMTTAEYAMGIVAAVAFAGILYKVVTSGTVMTALSAIIKNALSQH
jgi:hypothetical protein